MLRMRKYHGLGNDYLVISPSELNRPLTADDVRRICHRHYGVGSDGILLGPIIPGTADFVAFCAEAGLKAKDCQDVLYALRIYNPDGSEAEKSGNGLRIFSRYLHDYDLVGSATFRLATLGGVVEVSIADPQRAITVLMGKASFWSEQIPMSGPRREVLNEEILVCGRTLRFCAASVGNPHCVVFWDGDLTAAVAHEFGPHLETAPCFPRRANVQFVRVLDQQRVQMEIWERGAGYTLASGSSATAVAAVVMRLGHCQSPVSVVMPGGELLVAAAADGTLRQSGPCELICECSYFGLPADEQCRSSDG
jgi:diaminopimelate epimerase